ncbi:primase-helicase family protein [Parasediminibacterium paludis]|uniref:Primase-helicase family protein n=1 Tax=Parasediminibacterium paludis TaxID=908966 RepID=A0ABV8PYC8_9BACT
MAKAAKLFIQTDDTAEPATPPIATISMENAIPTPQEYYTSRMALLGINEANNTVKLLQNNATTNKAELVDFAVFSQSDKGIDILAYTLDRLLITYSKEGSRWKNQTYKITRLVEPIVKKDGSEIKYLMPKGEPVVPFFPPTLLAKYDATTTIDTLYLTEGYFKSFKASLHKIDCVGLPSITCLKDRETGELHEDIKKLILKCKVKRLVWLTDGDCRNLTTKDIKDGLDLYRRPNQFFRSVATFYDLTSKLENVQRYFAHINTDELDGNPKGLDDLLCAFSDEVKDIAKEFNDFSKKKEILTYSTRFEITYGIGKVLRYFYLHDVDQFYLYHIEKRPDLKDKEFRFNGTLYQYDEKENKCLVKIPSSAANYFRVGDDYFEFVEIPDKYGNITKQQHKRRKETIKDDNGKDIFKHIPKYRAFCNVPEHLNYQRIIHNCFNTYHPFSHEPEEGNFDNTIAFLKHIFGEDECIAGDFKVKRYELALDYLTILYKNPQQILPILCLVSKERQTGKTTFLKWLKMIFTENLAVVSNQDFENNFNSHWATKLIIGCDETKIEKHVVMERIKGLSTAGSIMKEGKGVDQVSMDFFGKFILLSNNEDNFASIDAEEIRFWIIKVPVIKGRNVNLLEDLLDEIPAFLHYLSQRSILTKQVERHWFDTRLLKTEALAKIVENSKPTVEKIIIHNLTQLFEASDYDTIKMGLDDVVKYLAKMNDKDKNYVKNVLNTMGYKTQPAQRNIYFPVMQEAYTENRIEYKIFKKNCVGRYYEFNRSDFLDDETTLEPIPTISNTPPKHKGVNDLM